MNAFNVYSSQPVFTYVTGGVRIVERWLLVFVWWAGKPRRLQSSLPLGMFQIFVRRTLFCALSPVPLSGGTAHAGFQLKILQSTLPCVISLRFCTSSLIIKYLGDNVQERHWFTAQIEHLSNFRVRDHSSCPPGANDGKVQRLQSAFLSFFSVFFFFSRLNSLSVGDRKRRIRGVMGFEVGGSAEGKKEEDEPACV